MCEEEGGGMGEEEEGGGTGEGGEGAETLLAPATVAPLPTVTVCVCVCVCVGGGGGGGGGEEERGRYQCNNTALSTHLLATYTNQVLIACSTQSQTGAGEGLETR